MNMKDWKFSDGKYKKDEKFLFGNIVFGISFWDECPNTNKCWYSTHNVYLNDSWISFYCTYEFHYLWSRGTYNSIKWIANSTSSSIYCCCSSCCCCDPKGWSESAPPVVVASSDGPRARAAK